MSESKKLRWGICCHCGAKISKNSTVYPEVHMSDGSSMDCVTATRGEKREREMTPIVLSENEIESLLNTIRILQSPIAESRTCDVDAIQNLIDRATAAPRGWDET